MNRNCKLLTTWLICVFALGMLLNSSVFAQEGSGPAFAAPPALPLPAESFGEGQPSSTTGGLSPGGRVVMSLAIVLGVFFLTAWFQRKRGSRHALENALEVPAEAVEVLGELPLGSGAARLVRVGAKLLLVVETANGLSTLTEVTEPAEVDRLTELCHVMNSSRRNAWRGEAA